MGDPGAAQILPVASGWYLYIVFGITGGFLSALLGIGGGVVMVPLLVLIAAFPQKLGQGTALGYMVGTCAVGALRYHYITDGVRLNIWVVLLLTAGGIVGALLGSVLADRLSRAWLQRLFAIVMLIAACKMVMQSFAKVEPGEQEVSTDAPAQPGAPERGDSP